MARTRISITGADRETFLQGLVTNDARVGALSYSALLTPQGKFIADFFLEATPEAILLDVAESHAAALIQRLTMYRLRADVAFETLPGHLHRGVGEAPDDAHPDPRHAALGWRAWRAEPQQDDTDWDALRVAHVIPETGVELTADSYILEMGFERLNGVDFRKGCFVGQEIVARMKHKTELKKGLTQVTIEGTAPSGTPITADGKPAGTLYTQSNGRALAHLRFDRAGGLMQAGDARLTRP